MSLRLKLVLAFIGVALSVMLVVALFAGRAASTQFGQYLFQREGEANATALATYYEQNGSWAGVAEALRTGHFGPSGMGRGGMMKELGPLAVTDDQGRVLIGGAGFQRGELVPRDILTSGVPVTVDGATVGMIVGRPRTLDFINPAAQTFLNRFNRALILAGIVSVGLALLLAGLLSGRLTASIRDLTEATRAVASGDLGRQVSVRTGDEVGELATSFNRMSLDLARGEAVRKQMTADIAHELRTPLSLILGHAEALRDGVLPLTRENASIVHDEAARLTRIVEDLRTLSLVEAGELPLVKSPSAPAALLSAALGPRRAPAAARRIELMDSVEPDLPLVDVDPDRMVQVMGNLIDNALHHTPDGGQVRVAAAAAGSGVQLEVRDSGKGLRTSEIPHLFERFYRADKARSRDDGGSGLGLAIAKSIVEAHGGTIWAENAPGGGARFVVGLPAALAHGETTA
jgi:signal transduction histidine kinase